MQSDYDIPTLSKPKKVAGQPACYFQALTPNVRFKITKGGLFAKAEGEEQACVQLRKRTIHFWEHAGWVHICFPSELMD